MPNETAEQISINPVFAEQTLKASNAVKALNARPWLSALTFLLLGFALTGLLAAAYTLLLEHGNQWFRHWPMATWTAITVVCLGTQVPQAKREHLQARHGWLAALPQMPEAMQVWTRGRSLFVAGTQIALLLTALATLTLYSDSPNRHSALDYALAVCLPALVWLILPRLSHSRPTASRGQRFRRNRTRHKPHRFAIVMAWQRAEYAKNHIGVGARWAFGFVCLLVTANAGALEVAGTLMVGSLLIQWHQFWSAGIRVTIDASQLTRTLTPLPTGWLLQLVALNVLASLALSAGLAGLLLALGLKPLPCLLLATWLFAVLILQLATVLAWRFQPRWLGVRCVGVLVAWLTLSQAMPFTAPFLWLALCAWLWRRAIKVSG
jgi:hypothetical protein